MRNEAGAWFVRGLENPQLLQGLTGTIVHTKPVGGVLRFELPHLTGSALRTPRKSGPLSIAVGGPDSDGNVIYLEDHMEDRWHQLVLLGTRTQEERIVYKAAGSAMLDQLFGDYFALSRSGDTLAYVRKPGRTINPGATFALEEGTIELCNVADGVISNTNLPALDNTLCWSSDGKRLIHSKLMERDEALRAVGRHFELDPEFRDRYAGWSRLPVVCAFDVATQAVEPLCIGEHPVLSPDGTKLIVRDTKILMRMLRLDTDAWEPIELPGMVFPGAFAFVRDDLVLYPGWPTEGAEEQWSFGSPLAGKKQVRTLKIGLLGTHDFVTVVDEITVHTDVSFGAR